MRVTLNDLLSKYHRVYRSGDPIPDHIMRAINSDVPGISVPDYVTPLQKGKAWLFEELCKYQPRTGRILTEESGELILGETRFINTLGKESFNLYLFLDVRGRIIRIKRNFKGSNPHELEEADPEHWKESRLLWGRYKTLPEVIARAYYHRFDGLDIPEDAIPSYRMRRLPSGIGAPWQSIDGYLEALRLKKEVMPLIEERFPDTKPLHGKDTYTSLMIFLDTRPLSQSRQKEGDILFVRTGEIHSSREDLSNPKFIPRIEEARRMVRQEIYHVKDADFTCIRILTNPVEAIDRYCEHTLLDKKDRFDFLPFGREM